MKKYILTVITLFTVALGGIMITPTAGAINVFESGCGGSGGAGGAGAGAAGNSSLCGAAAKDDAPTLIKNVINILLYLVGIIAVIAIIIGGIRYVTSNGDSGATKSAKDTVLYAVIGLVVAILAFAIVNFVVTAFQ